jgi:hypothetical protein
VSDEKFAKTTMHKGKTIGIKTLVICFFVSFVSLLLSFVFSQDSMTTQVKFTDEGIIFCICTATDSPLMSVSLPHHAFCMWIISKHE